MMSEKRKPLPKHPKKKIKLLEPVIVVAELPKKQTFQEHLSELRQRLLICAGSIFLLVFIVSFFHERLLELLVEPLHASLFYNAPIGALSFTFTVVFFVGMLLSIPIVLYEVLMFLAPAFPQFERKVILLIVLVSVILFTAGILFGYYVSLPVTIHFFNTFSSPELKSLITTDEYLSFITEYLFAFGLVFEIPLVFYITNHLYRLDHRWLLKQQRYVIVFSFLAGAILTPDPLNQCILAIPLVVLYEISIAVVWLMNRGKKIQATY